MRRLVNNPEEIIQSQFSSPNPNLCAGSRGAHTHTHTRPYLAGNIHSYYLLSFDSNRAFLSSCFSLGRKCKQYAQMQTNPLTMSTWNIQTVNLTMNARRGKNTVVLKEREMPSFRC
ncbi:hypothetical protein ATANTOWER_011370 [Ataeniobius toweri]|uniref:Uncharacterized protein n=1 Tax=Ataeniobius toweri TaxID=208326 RepID=A0ABU7AXA6_9TELE|nr:hypothetical protein [Ataeniobius toweri]